MSHDTIEVRLIGLPVYCIVKLGGRFLKQLHHHCESLDHTIQELPNEVIFLFVMKNRDPPLCGRAIGSLLRGLLGTDDFSCKEKGKEAQVPVPKRGEALGSRPRLVKAIMLILRVAPVDEALEVFHSSTSPQVPEELTDFAPSLPLCLAPLARLRGASGQGWGAGVLGASPGSLPPLSWAVWWCGWSLVAWGRGAIIRSGLLTIS